MFEQAFGEDTEADRKALEKIEVSFDEEQQLGKQILQSGLASLKESGIAVETKGQDVEYLASLVATLKPYMRNKDRYKTIQVIVARSPRIDARSGPGGTLVFFEGLLDAAGSEAALAGIVGHELSHLDRGHQLLPIRRVKRRQVTRCRGYPLGDVLPFTSVRSRTATGDHETVQPIAEGQPA